MIQRVKNKVDKLICLVQPNLKIILVLDNPFQKIGHNVIHYVQSFVKMYSIGKILFTSVPIVWLVAFVEILTDF